MSGRVCLVCEYVCINVRGNSSLRAVGSSCRRAVFVQPGFVGISYPTHVWERERWRGRDAGGDGGGIHTGAGNQGSDSERERRTFFFSVTCLFCGLRAILCDPLERVMLQAKGRSQTTRQTESRNAWSSGLTFWFGCFLFCIHAPVSHWQSQTNFSSF